MAYWISRDNGVWNCYISIHRRKPTYIKAHGIYTWDSELIDNLCVDDFIKATKFKIKPGECKRIRFKVEEY